MYFYDIDPMALEPGSRFYFNVMVHIMLIHEDDDFLPKDIDEQWYCNKLTDARPKIYGVCRTDELSYEEVCDIQCYPHCVVEITKEQEVLWYDMLDFDTDDPWEITIEEEEEDDDDFSE